MFILGIETSCDETAAAIIEDGQKILSSSVATSLDMHKKTGGIIPENAAREQIVSILPVISHTLNSASLDLKQIDAIAVTCGPGLIGSLLVGVETAKTLSYILNKPIVPVNHLVGHIYANFVREFTMHNLQFTNENTPEFPAVVLIVSGGHTDLVYMESHQKITWIGGTRDDAAGEAFDKTARLLGLPYPGGPSISAAAEKFLAISHKPLSIFPRPMMGSNDLDMSFSGLKTAVFNMVKGQEGKKTKISKNQIAAEVQEAIVDVLISKSISAIKKYHPKSFLLAGGVAANKRLKEKFQEVVDANYLSVSFHVPHPILCTDNAIFIASSAFFNYHPVPWKDISANAELTISS